MANKPLEEQLRIKSNFGGAVGNLSRAGKVGQTADKQARQIFEDNPWLVDTKHYPRFLKHIEGQPASSEFDDPWHVQVARKFLQLHSSAKRRGKDFNLTLKDVANLLRVKKCYYTGVELTTQAGNYKLTIDRVNNDKGYTKDNVVACCHLANQIKNELFERPTGELRANIEFVRNLISKL